MKARRRRTHHAELLLEVSNTLAVAPTLGAAFDAFVQLTTREINAERGSIFLNDQQADELYTQFQLGHHTHEIRMMNHMGVAGHVFVTGTGAIANDPYSDPRFNREVDQVTGFVTRNILCAPIRTVAGDIIGAAELLNKRDGSFTDDDLELLETMVKQAAIVLENRRSAELIAKERQHQLQLLHLVSEISTEIKLRPLLNRLIPAITKMLDAERSTLFINDEKTGELYTEIGEGLGIEEIRMPNTAGIAGAVFQTGQSVNIPHAYADLRFNPAFDKKTGFFTRSILCVPVINNLGKRIGVTQVLNKAGGCFTEEDEARLKAFTSQIAIALENAKLFDDVQNMQNYNESILESMSSGVITFNEEGKAITCNAAALKIMKVRSEDVERRSASELFTEANAFVVERIWQVEQTRKANVMVDAEMIWGGQPVFANLTILPLESTNGDKLGSLVMIENISSEKRLKSTMARYMDPIIAETLVQAGSEVLGGQSSRATVLFSDIRSFTTLSEELGAQPTVSLLNEYFTIMVDCVQYEGGMLDKFIGDAMMAVFGIPVKHEDDPDRAVQAGINMLLELAEFNRRRAAEGKKPINIGIGVNTDTVVSGNIGSPRRMDYTVIGDGVNLASRLESLCKKYQTRLLVSEFTYNRLNGTYRSREIDRVIVQGKTTPVGVFEILDAYNERTFPNLMQVLEWFREGVRCYRMQAWEQAMAAFKKALALHPDDYPSRMYLERCEQLRSAVLPPQWNGVWIMQSKD